jgi:hypothetical protein
MVLEQFILGMRTILLGGGNNAFLEQNNAFAELNQCLCGPNPMLWQAESNDIEGISQ